MIFARALLPITMAVIFLAISVEGRNRERMKAYQQIRALQPSVAQEVCEIILSNSQPKTTTTNTQTITLTRADSTIAVTTTMTITPAVQTVTDTIVDPASTTTSTPVTTSTTYTATVLRASQPMRKRAHDKSDRELAHKLLRTFNKKFLRAACIDVVYQGNAAQASTSTVIVSNTATQTQSASTVTATVVDTSTAATQTITRTTHTAAPVVTITAPTSTVTVSATKTEYISLPTNSASYCGAESAGCQCVVNQNTFSVSCTYSPIGRPQYFVAPCTGKLAATMQGGGGGKFYSYGSRGGSSLGSSVTSPAIGMDSTSAASTTFTTNSLLTIRVGTNGGNADNPPSYGAGGYNGGGNGGCSGAYNYCNGGGGGATDLSYNAQVILAAGGAGGGGGGGNSGLSSNGPTQGRTYTSGSAPQGGSATAPATGGGGGGGYAGGSNGFYDQSPGYAGFSLLSSSLDTTTFPASSGSAGATLTFTCTGA